MSGRTTLDTNSLRVRQVFALNPSTQNYVQPFQIPMIYEEGRLQWYSTMEFLSTISVPVTAGANWGTNGSNTLSNILTQIQPGLSTFALITQENFLSTVNHLQNTGVGGPVTGQGYYISTQTLNARIARLSQDNQYVSTNTLWFATENLANLGRILTAGPMTLVAPPLQLTLPTGVTNIGYVSTIHPGEYNIYYSSFNLAGTNLENTSWADNEVKTTTQINTIGYTGKITHSSMMVLDVNLNMEVTASAGLGNPIYISSYVTEVGGPGTPLGTPVVSRMGVGQTSLKCNSLRFILASNQLPTPFTNKILQVQHRLIKVNPADPPTFTASTWIPETSGIFLTLNNQLT